MVLFAFAFWALEALLRKPETSGDLRDSAFVTHPTDSAGSAQAPERLEYSSAGQGSVPPTDRTIQGRCIDRKSGSPQAAIIYRVRQIDLPTARPLTYAMVDDQDNRTDSDGHFRIAVHGPMLTGLREALLVVPQGLAAVLLPLGQDNTVAAGHIGDIGLESGIKVMGEVRDSTGNPLPGSKVRLTDWAVLQKDGTWFYEATADLTGSFSFPLPVAPRHWIVRVAAPNVPTDFGLRYQPSAESSFLRITAPTATTIAGTVVTQSGSPVPFAGVVTKDGPGQRQTVSDADGRFVLTSPELPSLARLEVVVGAVSPLGGSPQWSDLPIPWGSREVILRLDTTPSIALKVEDEVGRPVEWFAIKTFSIPASDPLTARPHSPGIHPGGIITLPGLPFGPVAVQVIPLSRTLLSSDVAKFDTRHGTSGTLHLVCPAATSVMVRVVDRSLRPIEDALIEVFDSSSKDVTEGLVPRDFDYEGYLGPTYGPYRQDHGMSGKNGVLELRYSCRSQRVSLRITHKQHVMRIIVFRPPLSPFLEVILDTGAALTVSVTPSLPSTARWEIVLRSEDGHRLFPHDYVRTGGLSQGADGFFRAIDIPPGAWKVLLCADRLYDAPVVTSDVQLGANSETALTLSVADALPGRVSLFLNGLPAGADKDATLAFYRLEDRLLFQKARREIPIGGSVRVHAELVAGTYIAVASVKASDHWQQWVARLPIKVLPSQATDESIAVERYCVHARLQGADGKALSDVAVRLITREGGLSIDARSDKDGIVFVEQHVAHLPMVLQAAVRGMSSVEHGIMPQIHGSSQPRTITVR